MPEEQYQSAPTHDANRWERAYQAFETQDEELRKFLRRLRQAGADRWDRDWRVLEVCSGRGTGLAAWHALGFRRVYGVDQSKALVFAAEGPGGRIVGDARALPLLSASVDVVVVQGGLHHLFTLEDVDSSLSEMRRVVSPAGRIVIIEPWLTPFLRVVHFVTNLRIARALSKKLDALATMIEEERTTYERWLRAPEQHLGVIRRHVKPQYLRRRWGKLFVIGSPMSTNRV